MVTTRDSALWEQMWSYKDHGKSLASVNQPAYGTGFRWVHDSFGTNWRMTEMQSAIGRIQLKHLTDWHQRRLHNATRIWETSRRFSWLRVPDIPDFAEHACYKAYVFIEPDRLPQNWTRATILDRLNGLGIPVYTGSCPEVYMEKALSLIHI